MCCCRTNPTRGAHLQDANPDGKLALGFGAALGCGAWSPLQRIIQGPRYDHHFLAIPAAATGQGLLVAPEILVADLLRHKMLIAIGNRKIRSGVRYHAYSVDRSGGVALEVHGGPQNGGLSMPVQSGGCWCTCSDDGAPRSESLTSYQETAKEQVCGRRIANAM